MKDLVDAFLCLGPRIWRLGERIPAGIALHVNYRTELHRGVSARFKFRTTLTTRTFGTITVRFFRFADIKKQSLTRWLESGTSLGGLSSFVPFPFGFCSSACSFQSGGKSLMSFDICRVTRYRFLIALDGVCDLTL